MMPKINPKQMQQMMHRMGISQNEIPAVQVIIRCEDRDIIIDDPQVLKVDMMGQKMFQVSGTPFDQPRQERDLSISGDDIKTVMDQTNTDHDAALQAIKDANGDLAQAILKLSEKNV
ncbi:nascent polypeptide-associated complex protein [Candidatus Woesearchaeota archaeon]|nr:nascent polypeptide-associated complex protein [Candidatus Woesearchaeota archaeon]